MTWYVFEPIIALDPTNDSIAKNAAGQVYATTDTTYETPLSVTDLAGIVRTELIADSRGYIEQFRVEDHPVVLWKSGDHKSVVPSIEGIVADARGSRAAAETAQLAAETAANAALAAQAAAEDAASGSTGGGGAGNGNIFAIDWDGVGTQPTRVYPSWHPDAGATIPLPPEVVVRWRQPSYPLGVAADGDEFRRVG